MITRLQLVRLGERFADQHFARAPGLDVAAAAQVQIIQDRPPLFGHGNQPANGGLGHAGHVQIHILDDPGLHAGDARNFGDPFGQRVGSAFQVGENVSKPIALVIDGARTLEGFEGVQRHDKHRHAAADNQADGQRLAFHAPQIPPQLPVQRRHRGGSIGNFQENFKSTHGPTPGFEKYFNSSARSARGRPICGLHRRALRHGFHASAGRQGRASDGYS